MNKLPKISIITVCYNADKYLKRTIGSVINQTYSNLEYLVIDGNSTDKSIEIIKKHNKHIDFWISEPDKNLYDAMNKGLHNATGEYVLFLNAGDSLYSNTSLEEAIKKGNNSDFIYSKAVLTNEEGKIIRNWHKKTPIASELNAKSFINGMVVCHNTMIVKKKFAPTYNINRKISNDLDWSIRVMKKIKTKYFHDRIFCKFLEGGISNRLYWLASKERFGICVEHFGMLATLFEQIKLTFQFLKRKLFEKNILEN